jgi:hypothetical protein
MEAELVLFRVRYLRKICGAALAKPQTGHEQLGNALDVPKERPSREANLLHAEMVFRIVTSAVCRWNGNYGKI